MTTTSGRSVSARDRGFSVAGFADNVDGRIGVQDGAQASRTVSWSSASKTRMRSIGRLQSKHTPAAWRRHFHWK
jgi:hypothetical protein